MTQVAVAQKAKFGIWNLESRIKNQESGIWNLEFRI